MAEKNRSKLVVVVLIVMSLAFAGSSMLLIGHPVAKAPKRTEFVIPANANPESPPDAVSDVAAQFFAKWTEDKEVQNIWHWQIPLSATYIPDAQEWHVEFRRKRADVQPGTATVFVNDGNLEPRIDEEGLLAPEPT